MPRPYLGAWRVIPPEEDGLGLFKNEVGEIARLRAILRLQAARARIQLLGADAPAASGLGEFSQLPGGKAVRAAIRKRCNSGTRARYEELCAKISMADVQAGMVVEGVWASPVGRPPDPVTIVLVDGLSLTPAFVQKINPAAKPAGLRVVAVEFSHTDFIDLIRLLRSLIRRTVAFNRELEEARDFVSRLRSSLTPGLSAR